MAFAEITLQWIRSGKGHSRTQPMGIFSYGTPSMVYSLTGLFASYLENILMYYVFAPTNKAFFFSFFKIRPPKLTSNSVCIQGNLELLNFLPVTFQC